MLSIPDPLTSHVQRREESVFDGSAQVLWEESACSKRFPACGGLLRSLDGDLPERALLEFLPCRRAAHLVWGDLRKAAAVAESSAELVVGI